MNLLREVALLNVLQLEFFFFNIQTIKTQVNHLFIIVLSVRGKICSCIPQSVQCIIEAGLQASFKEKNTQMQLVTERKSSKSCLLNSPRDFHSEVCSNFTKIKTFCIYSSWIKNKNRKKKELRVRLSRTLQFRTPKKQNQKAASTDKYEYLLEDELCQKFHANH